MTGAKETMHVLVIWVPATAVEAVERSGPLKLADAIVRHCDCLDPTIAHQRYTFGGSAADLEKGLNMLVAVRARENDCCGRKKTYIIDVTTPGAFAAY